MPATKWKSIQTQWCKNNKMLLEISSIVIVVFSQPHMRFAGLYSENWDGNKLNMLPIMYKKGFVLNLGSAKW